MNKTRSHIKQKTKVRSSLQKEVNSACPFCLNEDVEHFQIHHIDENPQNNNLSNLILLCPTCHSKITKSDISQELVKDVKAGLISKLNVEIASISMDSNNCSWISYDDIENAFVNIKNDKSVFPIINFTLINHTLRTIVFKEIVLTAKHLFSGFSGIPEPRSLKPIGKFKISIPKEGECTRFKLIDEIEVPSAQAFKFQIQIHEQFDNKDFPIDGKKVLHFTFKFNNLSIYAPAIFLNCKKEDEGVDIYILH